MKVNKFILLGAAVGAAISYKWFTKVSIPKGAKAVQNFDLERYLGKWYEIARLDYRWERNLNNVTARYSLNKDGSIRVDNRGYDFVNGKWKQSIGKAIPLNTDEGRLKVSFFGPFYSGYNIIAIDEQYRYALIAGNDLGNLWILSRDENIPQDIKTEYLKTATQLGYKTDRLIWVEHKHK